MKNITIEQLGRLSDPYYHKEIGVETKWRIGDGAGPGKNAIFPYYTADQCREILDNVCGITGWGNEYREVAGYLFAVISIIVEGRVGVPAEYRGVTPCAACVAFLDRLYLYADAYYSEQIGGDFCVFVAPAGYP